MAAALGEPDFLQPGARTLLRHFQRVVGRLAGGLVIDDLAFHYAAGRGHADANDIEAAAAGYFAHEHHHLASADFDGADYSAAVRDHVWLFAAEVEEGKIRAG